MTILNIFTDGGARGNPGPAAAGWVVRDGHGKMVVSGKKYLGETTNNVAEYQAVLCAYDWLIANSARLKGLARINFYLDSRLVVSQLRGRFKIKARHLMPLIADIKGRERKLRVPVFYHLVPRERNKEADGLVNRALDERVIAR